MDPRAHEIILGVHRQNFKNLRVHNNIWVVQEAFALEKGDSISKDRITKNKDYSLISSALLPSLTKLG